MRLSIVIPHYNSEETLRRLLDTIPTSYDWLEVFVVDDRSTTDYDPEAIHRDYPRVKLLSNTGPNKGAGAARNEAIKHCQGEWLLFADADDFFLPEAFDRIEAQLSSSADVIYFLPESKDETGGQLAHLRDRTQNYRKLVNGFCEQGTELPLRLRFFVPWSKLIKRSLVTSNDIRFDEVIAGNDLVFSVKCGLNAKKIDACQEPIYCVTRSLGTLTTQTDMPRLMSRLGATIRYNKVVREKGLKEHRHSLMGFVVRAKQLGLMQMLKVIVTIARSGEGFLVKSPWNYVRRLPHYLSRVQYLSRM